MWLAPRQHDQLARPAAEEARMDSARVRTTVGIQLLLLLGTLSLLGGSARADCPPDCVAGGGPAATDCFVQWGGITAAKETCTDGDPTCDTDGKADGVCTFGLQACVNVAGTGCTPAPLTAVLVHPTTLPSEAALSTALTALIGNATQTCTASTPGFTVALKGGATLGPIKKGLASFKVTGTADKPDADKLKLTCVPGAQLARDVQPIFTAKCATTGCHAGTTPAGAHTLEDGLTYADNVNVKALNPANGLRVKPGSVKGSFLAKKILALGIKDGTLPMPSGCPATPPTSGCLTPQEIVTILSWIQRGAPND
jgi:hypothetical protein